MLSWDAGFRPAVSLLLAAPCGRPPPHPETARRMPGSSPTPMISDGWPIPVLIQVREHWRGWRRQQHWPATAVSPVSWS